MITDYGKRVVRHYVVQQHVLWALMQLAQDLCPDGEWVFQLLAHREQVNGRIDEQFVACITNGDDDISARDTNPAGAVAKLLGHMLSGHGNPFPLTGNGGVKRFPADNGWIRAPSKTEDGE